MGKNRGKLATLHHYFPNFGSICTRIPPPPLKAKMLIKNIDVGYVYIEESFGSTFNMDCYGSKNIP